MFTGIVQGRAQVHSIVIDHGVMRLQVQFPDQAMEDVTVGASVAINGVCLTVVENRSPVVCFDVIAQTLQLTNLAKLQVGQWVNYERSLKFGDEIGGHLLSGHIAGLATVTEIEQQEGNLRIRLQVGEQICRYLFDKGFVALNGCSLTVADLTGTEITVG